MESNSASRTDPIKKLTRGKLLARNTIFNLIGQGSPIIIAFFAIPILIGGLGTARFGILTLAWVVIGYFSFFDFGLGRALTKLVAEKMGSNDHSDIPHLVWTAIFLMLCLGLLGSFVLAILSQWLVNTVIKIPETLRPETLRSFYLLAASIPIVICNTGFRGVLEAQQRFGFINVVRIFMGIFTFLGPVLVLPFSNSLFPIVIVLFVGRFIALLTNAIFCFRSMPVLRHGAICLRKSLLLPLVHFGGWMTVTNMIGPLMIYLDRFLIGSLLTVTAVAFYTTPYEIVIRILIIPGALVGVLLPAFSISFVKDNLITSNLFRRSVKYVFLFMFPVSLVIVTFSREGLDLWIGSEFAENSTFVLQCLTIGVFINSMARVSFVLLQGIGRPDLTAKLHLVELPIYLYVVWILINAHGIQGAAVAWTGRVIIDAIFLFIMAHKALRFVSEYKRHSVIALFLALLVLISAIFLTDIIVKCIFILVITLVFLSIGWFVLLANDERLTLKNSFRLRCKT